MPGIVGIFSPDQLSSENEQSFPAMCGSLKHTNAQKVSNYRYKNLLLGRVDLGIFQSNIEPRQTDDMLVFIWGELVNPQPERKDLLGGTWSHQNRIDDIEFLIGLVANGKHECASYLRGAFNAVILDKQSGSLKIVNDRFGFRPLYYRWSGSELVFSSEVKAILKYKGTKKVVNPAGLADFFSFGFVTGDKTFFDGIEMLPAGGTLICESRKLKIKKYWNVSFTEQEQNTRREEVDHIHRLAAAIKHSVTANTQGEFRFGLPLSGGLDSRTIAACVAKDKYPLSIYTWGMPNSHEVKIARQVADTLGLNHHNLHRTPEEFVRNFEQSVIMTDGMIPANLPLVNFLYESCFAPCVDICLDGMQSISMVHPIRFKPFNEQDTVNQLTLTLPTGVLKTILADSYYELFHELAALSSSQLKESIKAMHPINGHQFLDITQKQRRLDNFGVIVKRNFVEVRSPLFDYPVIDVVQTIPPKLRRQRYIYYKAFSHISADLAKIINVGTMVPINSPHWLQLTGRIAKGVKSKVYQTFYEKIGIDYNRHKLCDWGIDYSSWYSESIVVKEFVREVLSRKNINDCEHLNPKGVEEILDAQCSGRKNHAEIINRLMTYAIWRKNFL